MSQFTITFFTEKPFRLSSVTFANIVFPSRCHSCWTTVTLPTGLSGALPAYPGDSVTKINSAAVSSSNLHIFHASWGEHRWKHMSEGFGFQARFGQRREPGLPSLSPALWTGDRGE